MAQGAYHAAGQVEVDVVLQRRGARGAEWYGRGESGGLKPEAVQRRAAHHRKKQQGCPCSAA